ncbi:MAG: DUF4837 family protein [Candidatus Delongbacteria bacterium]|nr:DUF4837 family protein [Candidatus Delongbacteria bacterium]
MKIKNRVLLVILILLSLVVISCSGIKSRAVGKESQIIVVADEEMFDMFKPALENIYTDAIYTPMLEERFTLKRMSLAKFKKSGHKFKNIIMLADIDGYTEESEYISAIFTDKIKEGVRESEYYYVVKNDIWAKGQLILFLLDSKEMYLSQYLEKHKGKMFDIFNDKMVAKIKDNLFDRFNAKGAQKLAKEKKGIDLFVPHDFAIVNEGEDIDFIRFRRWNPDRWLTVIKGEFDENLSLEDNIVVLRDAAGSQFGDSVRINTELLTFKSDSTFAKGCIKAQGLWEYLEGGGPFFTYGFVKKDMLYLVDGAVFAPEREKYPYIIQLDLMARTVKFPE